MEGLSKKIYLELSAPTEEDSRSDQQRILEALSAEGIGGAGSYACPHFANDIPTG